MHFCAVELERLPAPGAHTRAGNALRRDQQPICDSRPGEAANRAPGEQFAAQFTAVYQFDLVKRLKHYATGEWPRAPPAGAVNGSEWWPRTVIWRQIR